MANKSLVRRGDQSRRMKKKWMRFDKNRFEILGMLELIGNHSKYSFQKRSTKI